MSLATASDSASGPKMAWWREYEVALLVLLVLLGYFYRASEMSLRGEEPRRAQVAVEMIERGDWLVPREQGDPFLSRPPLHNWLIALSFLGLGERDIFAARLPSLLATLGVVLLLYGYGRTFLSRIGALAGAAAYATFGEIFQTGRMAETEAVFILLVSGSLLVWHWGMVRGWPESLTWSLGYGLMALGALAKSLQAPFYFVVSVTAYLLVTRQGRKLFSGAHVLGIAVGVSVLAAWNVPVYLELGLDGLKGIWMNDTAPRLLEWDGFLKHLVMFPLEVIGSTMPWSPLIFLFLLKDLRQQIGSARPQIAFLTLVLVLGFPTCWLPPGGMTRYLTPLYPCFALLLGFVVERAGQAASTSVVGVCWRGYMVTTAGMMLVLGLAIPAAGLFSQYRLIGFWAEPPVVAGTFAACSLGLAWLARRLSTSNVSWRTGWAVLTISGFMVLLFNGPVLNAKVRRGEDTRASIRKLKDTLPADAHFVSFGHIHAEFPFFYGRLVEAFPWPRGAPYAVAEGGYFCFNTYGKNRPTLPFAWEEVAAISIDRNKQAEPFNLLIVARRLRSD